MLSNKTFVEVEVRLRFTSFLIALKLRSVFGPKCAGTLSNVEGPRQQESQFLEKPGEPRKSPPGTIEKNGGNPGETPRTC